jgi:uncharacterized membrane protein
LHHCRFAHSLSSITDTIIAVMFKLPPRLLSCLAAMIAAVASSAAIASGPPRFLGLGTLAPHHQTSQARAISPDGGTVAGFSGNPSTGVFRPFTWNFQSGFEELTDPMGGSVLATPNGLSFDGSVVVGTEQDYFGPHGYRWTKSTGIQRLTVPGEYLAEASAVSADGKVSVGTLLTGSLPVPREAYRLSDTGGLDELGTLQGHDSSEARDVSADGSVVVGLSYGPGGTAFRWTKDGGMKRLATPFESEAHAVSADARVVVGTLWADDDSLTAVSWADDALPHVLGQLPNLPHSSATGVSGDGSVIVGNAWAPPLPDGTATAVEAFIWRPHLGMQGLHQVLSEEYGLDLSGWRLEAATDISADGLTIVGIGTGPRGVTEGWVVVLPEPQVLWLVAGTIAVMLHRHQRLRP